MLRAFRDFVRTVEGFIRLAHAPEPSTNVGTIWEQQRPNNREDGRVRPTSKQDESTT